MLVKQEEGFAFGPFSAAPLDCLLIIFCSRRLKALTIRRGQTLQIKFIMNGSFVGVERV